MKKADKEKLAQEVVSMLDNMSVNDVDKKKVISNAWQQVNKRTKTVE